MNQFITSGYTASRMANTARRIASRRQPDEWAPRARGPALFDRLGRTLVAVGVGMIRDDETLAAASATVTRRAA